VGILNLKYQNQSEENKMQNKPRFVFRGEPEQLVSPNEAFAFSLGHLLGDGFMKATEKRMCVEQSDLCYVTWKKKKMIELGLATETSKIQVVTRKRNDLLKKTKIETTSYRFESRSLFEEWHQPFYVEKQKQDPTYNPKERKRRRKRFPCELVFWFNHPLSLAIFYMDDGGVQSNQAYFATGEVSKKEVKFMQYALKRNFNLETTIRYSKKIPVGLLVRRKDCDKFVTLVQPYVNQVASMRYKLNITS
jgi:hypothetical protein